MFMGEYSHTVDAKGRLIVPSRFRESLGDEFVVTKGMDGCLFVYPSDEWKVIEEKFRNVSLRGKDARKFARILIPTVLREFAGLEKDVVLAGVLNRIEIWSRERWEEANSYDDMEEISEHMSDIGISI